MKTQQAFPLSWPASWKRTDFRRVAPFHKIGPSRNRRQVSMNEATIEIYRELKLIGVGDYNVVISTNVELRNDGLPYSNRARPSDPGAAVYFKLKGKDCVLACDKWDRVEDNLTAIAKHVEALRGQERWGVGSVEQAFAGYTALPAPGDSGTDWRDVLGVDDSGPRAFEFARDRYRDLAKAAHPDNGGSHARMVVLNNAWDAARRHFGQ